MCIYKIWNRINRRCRRSSSCIRIRTGSQHSGPISNTHKHQTRISPAEGINN